MLVKFTSEQTMFKQLQKIISCVLVQSTYCRLTNEVNKWVSCCSVNCMQLTKMMAFKLTQVFKDATTAVLSKSKQSVKSTYVNWVHKLNIAGWNLMIFVVYSSVKFNGGRVLS